MVTEYPAGWKCAAVVLQIERYLLNELDRAEMLAIAEHIEACSSCAHVVVLRRVTVATRVE